jgi:heme-degrading monooxygenase HmoA
MEFVSRSEIVVPISEMQALEQAFRERSHLVDRHAGYRGLELLRSIREDGRYVLLTRWRSQEAFRAYMKSGDHKRAHDRPHAGLSPLGGGGKLEQLYSVIEERADESAEL